MNVDPLILALVPFVAAVVAVMRQAVKWLDANTGFLPVLSILTGFILVAASSATGTLANVPGAIGPYLSWVLLNGLVVGLMASGAYSGGKATIEQLRG